MKCKPLVRRQRAVAGAETNVRPGRGRESGVRGGQVTPDFEGGGDEVFQ